MHLQPEEETLYNYELIQTTVEIPYSKVYEFDFIATQSKVTEFSNGGTINTVNNELARNPNLKVIVNGNVSTHEVPYVNKEKLIHDRAVYLVNAFGKGIGEGRVIRGVGKVVPPPIRTGLIKIFGTKTEAVKMGEVGNPRRNSSMNEN